MKISIIIPTRERSSYLAYSIQTALEIEDKNIEIIISDNASIDNTESVVKSFSDSRLKYINTGARVSMRENFNFALNESNGDYVIFFGDDDGILPRQFKYLRQLLEEYQPDGMTWNRATYGWPIEGYGKKTGGMRFYRDNAYGLPYSYDPHQHLDVLMGCHLSQLSPTPNIYHGCASREYLNKIAPKESLYFDSTIPDVNFEYRSIMLGGNFIHADHPFSINGYSPVSNGGSHKGYAEDDPRSKPAKDFELENKSDPFIDMLESARFVPLAFFATFETLRDSMQYQEREPDYVAWYNYVVSAVDKNPLATREKVKEILFSYASKTSTLQQLEKAKAEPFKPKRSFRERISRLKSQINSFRISAEEDSQNTILSAVHVYDKILGDDYIGVKDGTIFQAEAWERAKQRSKSFERKL